MDPAPFRERDLDPNAVSYIVDWAREAPTGEPLRQGIDRFFGYNCQAVAHNYFPTHLWSNDTHIALVAEVSGSADKVKVEKLTYAVDCGIAVHPDQVVAQLQGGGAPAPKMLSRTVSFIFHSSAMVTASGRSTRKPPQSERKSTLVITITRIEI